MNRFVAIHRHDISISDCNIWNKFLYILHSGLVRVNSILSSCNISSKGWIYIYPGACEVSGVSVDFASRGNLFAGLPIYDLPIFEMNGNLYYWRIGNLNHYWVNWFEIVNIDFVSEKIFATFKSFNPSNYTALFLDMIPDTLNVYERFGITKTDAIKVFYIIKGSLDPVMKKYGFSLWGNVYQGGSWLSNILDIFDGIFFENWRWHWATKRPLDKSTVRSIERRIDLCVNIGKMVCLGVPTRFTETTDEYVIKSIDYALKRWGEHVLFGEYR